MKAWQGRFTKKTNTLVEQYSYSIPYDCMLYSYDIAQSISYTEALFEAGIIRKKDVAVITKGLKEIKKDIETGKFKFTISDEDIHMAIEKSLIKKVAGPALSLQTGRSRNDQVATDLKMFLKIEISECKELIKSFQLLIINIAEENITTVMPGYTHLQKAQPVTLAHHLMAYFWMLQRDKERLDSCYEITDVMPLGSGALSGTPYKINRKKLAKKLGFKNISENSLDAVSSRDFLAQFLSTVAISMTNLSRLAEEVILWSTAEFGFIELDDSVATGSSLMPQKKNPDIAELIRAKAPMAVANFSAITGILKALPLSYNRDLQEDKKILLDSLDMYQSTLEVIVVLLSNISFNKEKMLASVENDFSLATEMADYLVGKGVGFRQAHEITGKIVSMAIENKMGLAELTLGQYQKYSKLFENDIFKSLKPETAVSKRKEAGGTSPGAVKKQIEQAKGLI